MKKLLLLGLIMTACNPKRLDTSGMAQEMRDRQVKHVTASQLAELANQLGRLLTDSLSTSPPPDTTRVGQLARKYGAEIQTITPEALAKNPDSKIREVAEAYQYLAEKNLPPETNLQKNTDGSRWLYTSPRRQADTLAGLWGIWFSRKELLRRL